MRLFLVSAGVLLAAAMLPAQDARPAWDVVSVKECQPKDPGYVSNNSPGRLSLGCWPLSRLIGDAYDTFADGKVNPLRPMMPMQLFGAPTWAMNARYTIDAKAETPQSIAMMRGPMMRVLLEERFHLKVHREAKVVNGFLMSVAKGGLKLKPTEDGTCEVADDWSPSLAGRKAPGGKPWCGAPIMSQRGSTTIFESHGMTMAQFATMLHPNGMVAIDQTGLTDRYEIHLELQMEPVQQPAPGSASDPSPDSSYMRATRDQLGLQLTSGKVKQDVIVVDHIEQPSGN